MSRRHITKLVTLQNSTVCDISPPVLHKSYLKIYLTYYLANDWLWVITLRFHMRVFFWSRYFTYTHCLFKNILMTLAHPVCHKQRLYMLVYREMAAEIILEEKAVFLYRNTYMSVHRLKLLVNPSLILIIFCVPQQHNSGLGSLNVEISRSHTIRHIARWTSLNVWTSEQLVSDTATLHETQQTQETNIHNLSWTRTSDPSKRSAADVRLRTHSNRDRRF
jgi:hypothetical protein